jgi:hypothetical protein
VALTQEEFTSRIQEINRNLTRTYDEMENDESIIKRIEGNKSDTILRIGKYYEELFNIGAFIDPETGRPKKLNEICRTIQNEMKRRLFTSKTQWYVVEVCPDKWKRAWRSDVVHSSGKQGNPSLPTDDDETASIYDSYLDHINELDNFDYNELPKRLRQNIAERMYKLYRHHDKQWTTHGLQVVKHEDGLSIPDPYAGIIRIERGEPYEGMAVDGIRKHIKLCREIEKKYLIGVMDSSGNRRISLDEEKKLYNAWAALDGYLRPWANDKWKRDLLGWCKIFKHKFKIKSKSGAAKFSRKKIFIDGKDVMRGITREEIDKNQPRLCNAFLEFIEFFPALIDLHSSFEVLAEPVRAVHSVMLHDKLSQSS